MAKEFSYDNAIAKVEDIITRLQSDDNNSVDKMIADVETAMKLLAQCKDKLTSTNEKLDKIFSDDD